MRNLMERYEPKQALAIAMDPDTGEILAMVSKPDFDPNSYAEYDADIINPQSAIWMSFEPGSTFKSVTFASALELDLFDMFTDTYYDRGYEIVGGARIKSWRAGGHGLQTFFAGAGDLVQSGLCRDQPPHGGSIVSTTLSTLWLWRKDRCRSAGGKQRDLL